MKYILLIIQVLISSFYAYFTLLMWGPFIEGRLVFQVGIAIIVFIPVLSLIAIYGEISLIRDREGLTVGVLTAVQLIVLFGLVKLL
jgi:hypothetical protein